MSYPSNELYPSDSLFPARPGHVLYVEQDLGVLMGQVSYSGSPVRMLLSGEAIRSPLVGAATVVSFGGTAATPGS